MKRLFPLLLLLPILTLSIVGCKDDKVSSAPAISIESVPGKANISNVDVKEQESNLDAQKKHEMPVDTVVSADELVKKAMEMKPTIKVVSKPHQKTINPSVKPVKKPVPNPVKSAPIKYLPKVEFDEMSHDFGEITEGDIIKHNFTFTNTGKTNLSIEKATATCGCTKPSFPFIDIKPGETGYIGVTYHSVNKKGPQKPEITVYSNANPREITLYLTGDVKPKPQDVNKEEGQDSTNLTLQDTTINK